LGVTVVIVTYFVLIALFWIVGLIIWKNYYVTEKEKGDE